MSTPSPLETNASTTNGTVFTTGSLSPTAGKYYLAAFGCSVSTAPTPTTVTCTGWGLTWTLVGRTNSGSNREVYLYRAVGTPTSGSLTFTGDVTMTAGLWSVWEVSGVDMTGTNGSAGIADFFVGHTTVSSSSASFNTGFTIDAGNAVHGVILVEGTQENLAPGAGWGVLGQTFIGTPSSSLLTEYDSTSPSTTVTTGTYANVGAAHSFCVAVELKEGPTLPPPPVSAFTSDVTSGSTPLDVQFTDTSTGSPTSWAWDFGDGNTSTAQNPLHTYTVAGTYNVTLTASNSGGADATPATSTITVTTGGFKIFKLRNGVYVQGTLLRLAGGSYQ